MKTATAGQAQEIMQQHSLSQMGILKQTEALLLKNLARLGQKQVIAICGESVAELQKN